jgi:hypothetical protein
LLVPDQESSRKKLPPESVVPLGVTAAREELPLGFRIPLGVILKRIRREQLPPESGLLQCVALDRIRILSGRVASGRIRNSPVTSSSKLKILPDNSSR